jgi:coenzyme F420 hydrogenase subunit beta
MKELAEVQPLQVTRRNTILGRLAGLALAGKGFPRLSGYPLLRLAVSHPTASLRYAYGTWRRARRL